MLSYVPSVIGTILVATLPGTNKIGLLFSYWISSTLFPRLPTVQQHPDRHITIASLGYRPVCHLPLVGRNVDIRPHKAHHGQRHSLDRLRDRQRRWTFHLAIEVQAKEQGPLRHYQRMLCHVRLRSIRHPSIPRFPEQEERRAGCQW
jgi:hypothetical protein